MKRSARRLAGFPGGYVRHYDVALLGSMLKLPFLDASFDVVVSPHLLGHIPVEDRDTLLSEMAQVLRPGRFGWKAATKRLASLYQRVLHVPAPTEN